MISEDDEPLEISTERRFSFNRQILTRNLIAFWLLGLCNNFGYVVMLSAAKDILERSKETTNDTNCIEDIKDLKCSTISTGAVLLADILPSLAIKLISPFFLHPIPYLTRHLLVVLFQTSSFLIVAYSKSITFGLFGVIFASLGAGLGEVTYLSLSSHFHNDAIHSWSSGTGGAGIFGSLAFAILTDHRLLGLTPQNALLAMLTVPAILFFTYWQILLSPPSVQRVLPLNPGSWFGQRQSGYSALNSHPPSPASSTDDLHNLLYGNGNEAEYGTATIRKILHTKIRAIKPLMKFMVPLTTVYFAEYFINQGLLELLIFDCSHSFKLSPMQQYRWNQVLYQIGVFISRSSIRLFPIRPIFIPILAILQFGNALFLLEESYFGSHLPHLLLLMAIILYEGLLGGAAYVNTFSAIHRTIAKSNREFSIAFVAISDSFGIVLAGFAAISTHNFICNHRQNGH